MRPSLVLAAILTTSAALAVDVCPPECKPKSPTCDERIARAKAHGCIIQPAPEVKIVEHTVTVPGPERVVTREVQVPGPERIVTQTTIVVEPPKGHWLVGAGPMYQDGDWGATAVAGHVWPSGWGLIAGPTWLPHGDVNGTATGCPAGSGYPSLMGGQHSCPCVTLPYHVPQSSAWGAQALVIYSF